MPYVMVPVPEEHEEEFIKELLAIGMRAAASAWNEVALRALMESLDPDDEALVRAVAGPYRQSDRLGATELAEVLRMEVSMVVEAIERVNQAGTAMSRGWVILTSPSTGAGRDGEPVYHLPDKAATLIRRLYR